MRVHVMHELCFQYLMGTKPFHTLSGQDRTLGHRCWVHWLDCGLKYLAHHGMVSTESYLTQRISINIKCNFCTLKYQSLKRFT